jgi:hypothetical protein
MTHEECHESLLAARRRQGTRFPRLRIDTGESIFQGRLRRAECDPEHRSQVPVHEARLVVVPDGASRDSEAIIPISRIPAGGISGPNDAA